jgi:pimeloyl-ACP methyl ester carboxylesterase
MEMQIEQGIIVGLSMGGYVGLQLLKDYPSMIKGLVLANSKATADTPEIREKRKKIIDAISKDGDIRPIINSHLPKFLTENKGLIDPGLSGYLREMINDSAIEGIINAQKAMASRDDYVQLLENTQLPLALIAADKDEFVPLTEYQSLAELIPDAHLYIIEDCAHISNMEQPERFNEILLNFITTYHLVDK